MCDAFLCTGSGQQRPQFFYCSRIQSFILNKSVFFYVYSVGDTFLVEIMSDVLI